MWVGYLGTPYRGLQIQRGDPGSSSTVEAELETAILRSGGMLASNYGHLGKLKWNRSSRTDKGVHSIATVISFNLEVPRGAWEQDPDGLELAAALNAELPPAIRVFSIVRATRSFNSRKFCKGRTYQYLLPAAVLGLDGSQQEGEARQILEQFRSILRVFEGKHPFHNYTVRRLYRPAAGPSKRSPRSGSGTATASQPSDAAHLGGPEGASEDSMAQDGSEAEGGGGQAGAAPNYCQQGTPGRQEGETGVEAEGRSRQQRGGLPEDDAESMAQLGAGGGLDEEATDDDDCDEVEGLDALTAGIHPKEIRRATWVHEPPGKDVIGSAHFRGVTRCSCGALESQGGALLVRITIAGESFMLHQIRKMIGSAVAVLREKLPRTLLEASLSRHARVVMPLAPAEGLLLYGSEFMPFRGMQQAKRAAGGGSAEDPGSDGELGSPSKEGSPPKAQASSAETGPRILQMSPPVEAAAHQFLETVLLPAIAPCLHVEQEPWASWLQHLLSQELVPSHEAEEVVQAWQAREADLRARFPRAPPGLGTAESAAGAGARLEAGREAATL